MNDTVILVVTSLLTIVLFTFHWADDVVRGISTGGPSNLFGVLILLVWLYGTLVLAGRRSGYVITLLGSLLGLVALVLHMRGAGLVGGRIANSSGVFFWVWTLITLGVAGSFSAILAARGLWRLKRGQPRQANSAQIAKRERGEGSGARRE